MLDIDDIFETGATEWTKIPDLIEANFPSFNISVVGESLSVNENLLNQVSLSPNPAQNYLNLKISSGNILLKATVVDISGKSILVNVVNNQIDVSRLTTGIYLLNLEYDIGSITKKFIKE